MSDKYELITLAEILEADGDEWNVAGSLRRIAENYPDDPPKEVVPPCFIELTRAAYGMSKGVDWNHGTHAHFYRRDTMESAEKCAEYLRKNRTQTP